MKIKRTSICWISGIVLVTILFMIRFTGTGSSGWQHIITSDGKGYYAYLPAVFIFGDLSFRQVSQVEKHYSGLKHYKSDYLTGPGGKTVNKYFAGEAILLSPFFLAALGLTNLSSAPADGYSVLFQIFTLMGGMFYLTAGLLFLLKILVFLGIRRAPAVFTAYCILTATPLLYYAMWQPAMSHVYSFALNNALLYTWLSINRDNAPSRPFWLGLLLGLALLVRPTNMLILLLFPVLPGEKGGVVNRLRLLSVTPLRALSFLFIFLPVILIQPVLWFLQTGDFFPRPYSGEGFYFSSPAISDLLFSYRKGLFIYAPVLLISLAGLIPWYRKSRTAFFFLILFLVVVIWITASWWNWYYGDGFGQRAFLDFLVAFALPLGLLIHQTHRAAQTIILILCLSASGLGIFQTWQYSRRIIHPFNMDREKYCFVFGKSSAAYRGTLGGNIENPWFGTDTTRPVAIFSQDFEKKIAGWSHDRRYEYGIGAFSGQWISRQDSLKIYSDGLDIQAVQISEKPRKYFLKVTFYLYDSVPAASNQVVFVIQMSRYDFIHNHYYSFPVNDIPGQQHGVWRRYEASFNLPEMTNPASRLKIFMWNQGRKIFYLDDFTIRFYQVRPISKTTA